MSFFASKGGGAFIFTAKKSLYWRIARIQKGVSLSRVQPVATTSFWSPTREPTWLQLNQLCHEKTRPYFPLYLLFNRDPWNGLCQKVVVSKMARIQKGVFFSGEKKPSPPSYNQFLITNQPEKLADSTSFLAKCGTDSNRGHGKWHQPKHCAKKKGNPSKLPFDSLKNGSHLMIPEKWWKCDPSFV